MNLNSKDLSNDFLVFYNQLLKIDTSDEKAIIEYCNDLNQYLCNHGLICRRYQLYLDEWKKFESEEHRSSNEKSLNELLVYLYIYSEQKNWTPDGNGLSYVRAFQNGTIPDIVEGIKRKLEEKTAGGSIQAGNLGAVGIAGEYFVVGELTRRGFVASLTSKNTKFIDVLVSDYKGSHLSAIQVKTSNNPIQLTWKMSESVEKNFSKNLYYVFVNLNNGATPSFYVVPSAYVAYRVKGDYDEWYATPGKKGQKRNKTSMRTFKFIDFEESEQYKDAWFLL